MRIKRLNYYFIALLVLFWKVNVAHAGQAPHPPASARSISSTHFQLVQPSGHLLGDWGGMRTRLEEHGITPTLTLVIDALGNPIGGESKGFTAPGNLGLDLLFDLEKLHGPRGGSFELSMSQRWDRSLSKSYIGNVFTTQQVFGGSTFKVIDIAYRQKLLDDHLEFRLGRIATGDDFLVSPFHRLFVQNAFCGNPVGIFFNSPGMTAYPNATWGGLAKVRPTERTYVMGGAYNGDEDTLRPEEHGVDFSMNGPLFAIMETGFHLNGLPGDQGLLGNYKAGIWYDNHQYTEFKSSNQKRGNWGFYGLFDQLLIPFGGQGSNRGFGVTGSALISPDQSVSQMPYFFTLGLVARGIFPSRPTDVAGFGVVYGHFSDDLQDAQRQERLTDPTVGVQKSETVLELFYKFKFLEDAIFIQPDVQYIIRPGGTGQIDDALACGLQLGINF